jgi:hypothetical protein
MISMAIEIRNCVNGRKARWFGFANSLMTTRGSEILDATVFQKNGERGIVTPAKRYQDKDGVRKYSYVVKLVAKNQSDKFQATAITATEKGHV